MNLSKLLAVAIATVALTTTVQIRAQTNVETFSFTNGLAVPDASLSGLADARNVTVLEPIWAIVDVNVSLHLSGGFNGDMYAYLTHGSGFSVLLNRPGRTSGNLFGYGDAGLNLTLDDAAATDLHLYGGNGGAELAGSWQPDGRNLHPLLALDTSPRTAYLDSFNGDSGNGVWTLFLADLSSGQAAILETWALQITSTPVPEPGTSALIILGAAAGLVILRKRK